MSCNHTFHRLGGIDDCPVCNPLSPEQENYDHLYDIASPPEQGGDPREWVCCGGSIYELGYEPKGYIEAAKIRLVQKSAYLAVCQERDALKTLVEFNAKQGRCNDWQARAQELERERDERNAEIELLKRGRDRRIKEMGKDAVDFVELQQQRDRLKGALERIVHTNDNESCDEYQLAEIAREALKGNE